MICLVSLRDLRCYHWSFSVCVKNYDHIIDALWSFLKRTPSFHSYIFLMTTSQESKLENLFWLGKNYLSFKTIFENHDDAPLQTVIFTYDLYHFVNSGDFSLWFTIVVNQLVIITYIWTFYNRVISFLLRYFVPLKYLLHKTSWQR